MISYCQRGKRRYDLNPIQPYVRNCWEIQAATGGELILLENGKHHAPQSNFIWLFGPACPHGWNTPPGQESEILVIHFQSMPDLCSSFCSDESYWGRACESFEKLNQYCDEILKVFKDKNPLNSLIMQKLQAEILLFLFEGTLKSSNDEHLHTRETVQQAVSWMQANLELLPCIEETAQHVHISESQLRRLFHQVLQQSPREILGQLKRDRACTLLRDTRMPVEQISRASGYENPSNFTRAFKKYFAQSPSDWRNGLNKPQYGTTL